MLENEKSFKKLMTRIGVGMLIFIAVFNAVSVFYVIADGIIFEIFDEVTATVISDVLYAIIYAVAFFVPALVVAKITKDDGTPLLRGARVSRQTPLYIIGGIACVLAFAYLNAELVSIFNYSEYSSEVLWQADYDAPYKIVLQLLMTAVAPGIFEEILFRGVILAKIRPYGKVPAVLISALLFALMHQNAEQFLYTFAAGIVLGFVAVETGSLLNCILIHFTNNAFSVLEQAAYANMSESTYSLLSFAVELGIFLFGAVCLIGLVFAYYRRRCANDLSEGIFGRELTLVVEDEPKTLSLEKTAKLSFTPTVIVFIAISFMNASMLIFESLIYSIIP